MALPTEIIEQILDYADNRDLKACRLANRRLALSATPRLFKHVRISLSHSSMKTLRNLADSETLRHLVREITWDDRRIPSERWQTRLKHETCPLAEALRHISFGHKQILRENYKQLFLEQEFLLQIEDPKRALVDNVHRFPHLDRLVMSDIGIENILGSQSPSQALSSGLFLQPSTWAVPYDNFHGMPLTAKDGLGFFALVESLSGPKDDFVPYDNIPVPRRSHTSVKHLSIHTDLYHAFAFFCHPSFRRRPADTHAFRFLESIEFCLKNERLSSAYDIRNSGYPTMSWDLSILNPAPALKKLSINRSYPWSLAKRVYTTHAVSLATARFPALVHLSLGYCTVRPAELISFIRIHRRTLRSLALEGVKLKRKPNMGKKCKTRWAKVWEETKKINIDLDWIVLKDLVDDYGRYRNLSEGVMRFLRDEGTLYGGGCEGEGEGEADGDVEMRESGDGEVDEEEEGDSDYILEE